MVRIDSVERALSYMGEIIDSTDDQTFDDEIWFEGELEYIQIVITGEKYHGTIPGELARGIWEYQEAVYKAAAFVLTGSDDNRKLTTVQRESLELVFLVEEGSTDLKASIAKFAEALGEGFKTMDSKRKMIILLAIAVLLAGGVMGWKALETSASVKKAEIQATLQVGTEAEKTKQFEIIARAAGRFPEVQKFDKAADEGTKAIIRSASDASNIKVGRANFTKIDIQEVNQRAPKTASEASIVDGVFRVFGTESKHADSTRYVLSGTDGIEFPVIVNHSELSADDLDKIWTAAKARLPIRLEVSVTKNKGLIKAAQVISVY